MWLHKNKELFEPLDRTKNMEGLEAREGRSPQISRINAEVRDEGQ